MEIMGSETVENTNLLLLQKLFNGLQSCRTETKAKLLPAKKKKKKVVEQGKPLAFQIYPDNSTPWGDAKNSKDGVTCELGATNDFS